MSLASSNKTEKKTIETLNGLRCCLLLLDNSNQSGWGMFGSLKWCLFEHTELPIHFKSSNDEYSIVKEA